jgi:hypothetical protein
MNFTRDKHFGLTGLVQKGLEEIMILGKKGETMSTVIPGFNGNSFCSLNVVINITVTQLWR